MKLDPYFISLQSWEVRYVAKRWKVEAKHLKTIIKACNNSRRKVYKALREEGYVDSKIKI